MTVVVVVTILFIARQHQCTGVELYMYRQDSSLHRVKPDGNLQFKTIDFPYLETADLLFLLWLGSLFNIGGYGMFYYWKSCEV